MLQLSHPYMTTGKTIALTIRAFVSKVMSLLFNTLSRFVTGDGTLLQCSRLENPMDGGAWWAAVHEVAKSRAQLSNFTFMHWRRKWQPTPVFLPGESQGRRSLVGCRPWGRTESDATERLSSSRSISEHALSSHQPLQTSKSERGLPKGDTVMKIQSEKFKKKKTKNKKQDLAPDS